jgi:membrane-associated phospholipid phosphatase
MAQSTSLPSQRSRIRSWLLFATLLFTQIAAVSAFASDPVLDWIAITNDSAISSGTNPLVTSRVISLVSVSVFDAVNGVEPRYHPLHVRPDAPRHASAGAAAVQAAYAILIRLYPALTPSLTTERDASISALSSSASPESIHAGMRWGQTVADSIWNWRLNDGFAPPPPPFFGVLSIVGSPTAIGLWRPTPLLNLPGAGSQFATMTPWVLKRASQFRLPPPYALTSPQYAADYNEIKTMGAYNSSGRTSDQSELVLFWAGNTPLYWDRIASQVAASRGLTLSQNAHLFALLNISIADGAVAVFDTKYRYLFWRPVTAIRSGGDDGNAATDPDPAWTPWLDFYPAGTPTHPEYPSAHATVSGAAAAVLAARFGDETPFTVTSDVRPGTRSFSSFSAAVSEIADARVYGGIHFRTSCVVGNALGQAVARYISTHAMTSDEEEGHGH